MELKLPNDVYYFNLSNIIFKDDKVYFLLSRKNKEGKESKFEKCFNINTKTIQNLLLTLNCDIQGLINLDKCQNENNAINVGVKFVGIDICWFKDAKSIKQSWTGYHTYNFNDVFYYNLSNVVVKDDKMLFLISRTNKGNKTHKFERCYNINSSTIQNLLLTLNCDIQGLINLDKCQNENNAINVGVKFNKDGIEWYKSAPNKKQYWFGPYIYSDSWFKPKSNINKNDGWFMNS